MVRKLTIPEVLNHFDVIYESDDTRQYKKTKFANTLVVSSDTNGNQFIIQMIILNKHVKQYTIFDGTTGGVQSIAPDTKIPLDIYQRWSDSQV